MNEIYVYLFLAATLSGFIDSIAGGGGLIAVPAILLAGLSPANALGTSKLQALFGSGTAAITYAQKGYVDLKSQLFPAIGCFVASFIGALFVTQIPAEFLSKILPVILISVAVYFLLKPGIGDIDKTARIKQATFFLFVAPVIAFYDGIFGPGAGSFYMLAFVSLLGFGLTKATAYTKTLNFASNIGALLAFSLFADLNWAIGLTMGAGQILGASIGARTAIKGGAKLIRPLLVVTCIALAIKLLLKTG